MQPMLVRLEKKVKGGSYLFELQTFRTTWVVAEMAEKDPGLNDY